MYRAVLLIRPVGTPSAFLPALSPLFAFGTAEKGQELN